MTEYRIIDRLDGRPVNWHLVDPSWEAMLTRLRGLLWLKQQGRLKSNVTFHVQRRDHGPAPWRSY